MGEIVLRITVPDGWGEEMKKALERRLVIDVARELQKRIEEAKRFEEIVGSIRIEDEGKARALEDEIAREIARRYGVV
ncbi:hypothetical protein X802_07615 [Thermococcus guaymasensis DSM 11113]|uniref:Uncharacterized protein n=1 Tax=Thermococcus guaymasensis DSM 11113 TaxID=1432656 RepID=A0A0X1KLA1_9EURY|nr:hypothetical protein [Thermococcus guaymasensis]AJC72042.1 hypothetical protein X802_07615 [Thermococcus guaymasensis DSM 11113]